jgi:presenilin 1
MLLAVFKKALPALPISIFAGVVVYLLTRTLVVPFIVELSLNGVVI